MGLFRKKPVVIEARQWDGSNAADLLEWISTREGCDEAWQDGETLIIPTLEGDHAARIGDWIIRGVQGEFYPCKPDIFDATYEKAV